MEWKRDYAEIQGQMIVGENVEFEELSEKTISIIDMINKKWH
jgi:hypothetical protein